MDILESLEGLVILSEPELDLTQKAVTSSKYVVYSLDSQEIFFERWDNSNSLQLYLEKLSIPPVKHLEKEEEKQVGQHCRLWNCSYRIQLMPINKVSMW